MKEVKEGYFIEVQQKDKRGDGASAMHADLERRLEYCHNLLPTLPGVAVSIINLANNPDTDMAEVAKVIAVDPALVVKIFRVANSPFYGVRRKITNLRQAISVLGLNATLTLALSFSLGTPLRVGRRVTLDTSLYWRRSLITAVASRKLGIQQGLDMPEELFLAGLLRDIGMLVFDSVMPTDYGPLVAAAQSDTPGSDQLDYEQLAKLERETLGADHAEVGAWLLRQWSLPEYLPWAVAGSVDPEGAKAPTEYASLTACVAVSGYIAEVWLNPGDGRASVRAAQVAKQWLNIDIDNYFAILNAIAEDLPETSALFEVQLLDPTQIASVLAAAKEILQVRNLMVFQEIVQVRQEKQVLESHAQDLEQQNRLDPLTGLYNRRWLDRVLQSEFECANQNGWPLSIAFIDLDHFKRVNDTYGHQAGDEVLISVARLLTAQLRKNDIVARYGGEEFVVVLPGVGTEVLSGLFQRILTAIRQTEHIIHTGESLRVTVSIGLAGHLDRGHRFETVGTLVETADQMVYAAKRQGRDRIIVFPG
jgi:diguanylate cyclase (GGDEF)-like protein